MLQSAEDLPFQPRLHVAAIDFGTTYSGFAFSFYSDFKNNPLKKIHANQWQSRSGGSSLVSQKAPSCVLFKPDGTFDSFGYEAEERYADLANDGQHKDWFFYSRFKMLLYENKDLSRGVKLSDDKGLKMSALEVFSACIRYLKDTCLGQANEKNLRLKPEETHWVLTVPAIWEDSAKQFMREAAVQAGIPSGQLTLALEPEAASLFCRHLQVERVKDDDGGVSLANFAAGKRYVVLDAGGGTVDITVHETLTDNTVKEVYKANGGPWGGTTIDKAFINLLEDIAGEDVMDIVKRDYKEDYLELLRSFETKKKSFSENADPNTKEQFRIPLSIHETYKVKHGTDFRQALLMKQDVKDQVSFTGDKLRGPHSMVKGLFTVTIDKIIQHLKSIFRQPSVRGAETILMVGGFSECKLLQSAVRTNFSNCKLLIPEDAGLAVLKGAVIFGHNPSAITARVAKYTYGIKTCSNFIKGLHLQSKKIVIDGKEKCMDLFDKHIEVDQEVHVGYTSPVESYTPLSKTTTRVSVKIFTSPERNPMYVDGCRKIGTVEINFPGTAAFADKVILVKLIYGNTELGIETKTGKTGEVVRAYFDFLG